MQNRLSRFVSSNFIPIFLVLLTLIIGIRNYTPGTFLSGWDTLHPEFNYKLYWERIVEGVWQEHQGLGTVATQAHASEIPRIPILMLVDLFVKLNHVRYMYVFLMLALGPLGIFIFLKRRVFREYPEVVKQLGSFAGAIFYLFNLSTLQHFYVPLEMFLTHFASLGWLFLFAADYIEERNPKSLLLFSLASFFSASQAHTSTLFYALILGFTGFMGILALLEHLRNNLGSIKRFFFLALTLLVMNMFWLLPNLYFVTSHGDDIQKSKIHHLFSQEAFQQNRQYGNIEDIAILRNFLFSWGEHVGNGEFGDLLDEWKIHYSDVTVMASAYIAFGMLNVAGFYYVVRGKKYAWANAFIFLAGFFFIMNVNPPFGFLFEFFQRTVPLFEEAFRFPFTKFSSLLAFSYSLFFGYFIVGLSSFLQRIRAEGLKRAVYTILYISILSSFVVYMFPFFKGGLVSPSMRVDIPSRYFEMFDYLNKQDDYGRIASFPIHSFWGWVYHNWDPDTMLGYQGAGFLWFGIKQPLLDREFDRWGLKNEQYFREMSYAVYSQDLDIFENLLKKYQIRWMLVDESIISPGSVDQKKLYIPEIKKLAEDSGIVKLRRDFGEGLLVYSVDLGEYGSKVRVVDDFVKAGQGFFRDSIDPIFVQYGDYISSSDIYYPFLGIYEIDEDVTDGLITSDEETISFITPFDLETDTQVSSLSNVSVKAALISNVKGGSIDLYLKRGDSIVNIFSDADIEGAEGGLIARINMKDYVIYPNAFDGERKVADIFMHEGESLEAALFKKIKSTQAQVKYASVLENCNVDPSGGTYSIERLGKSFKLFGKGINACVTAPLSKLIETESLEQRFPLVVEFSYESDGAKPAVCLLDAADGLCKNWIDWELAAPDKGRVVSYSSLEKSNIDNYFVRFFADGRDIDEGVNIYYKDVLVSLYGQIDKISAGPVVFEGSDSSVYDLSFVKDTSLSGNVTGLVNDPRLCGMGRRAVDRVTVGMEGGLYYRYSTNEESVCDSFQFPIAHHDMGYIVEVRSRNIEGMPLRLCLTNEFSKRCDLDVSLNSTSEFKTQYFLVPPMDEGIGYTFNFSNLVFGNLLTKNDLEYISLTPFPYNQVISLHRDVESVRGKTLLVYGEAYEGGWAALCGGFKVCDAQHVVVNNWANGWLFDGNVNPGDITIVYLPQILEYIGLFFGFSLLLGLSIKVFAVVTRNNERSNNLTQSIL